MLLKEQNEMDLIKHHLFSVTVYLCDCVYIHNKWFKRVLVHTIRIREIMCVSLGVWAQDWSYIKAHFLNISCMAAVLFLGLLFFFPLHCLSFIIIIIIILELSVLICLLQIPVCIWWKSRCDIGIPLFSPIHPVTPTSHLILSSPSPSTHLWYTHTQCFAVSLIPVPSHLITGRL